MCKLYFRIVTYVSTLRIHDKRYGQEDTCKYFFIPIPFQSVFMNNTNHTFQYWCTSKFLHFRFHLNSIRI